MPDQKLSEILKARREQKRLSLNSVHQETRISLAYLEALESADWKAFPAEVYLLGFLRKYAIYLGLNPEEMVQLYQKEQGALREKKEAEAKKQIEAHKEEESTTVMRTAVLAGIVVFVGAWLVFTVMRSASSHKKSESAPIKMKEIEPASVKDEKLSLALTAVEPVWVRVVSEQGLVFEGFLNARSSRTYEANDELSIRMGNVYAVRLALNGRSIDPTIGSSKSIGDMVLTRKSLYDENLYRARASSETAAASPQPASPLPVKPRARRDVQKSTAPAPAAPLIGPQAQ